MALSTNKSVIRDILVSKLPAREKCAPEAAALLGQLFAMSEHFNKQVTPGYLKLPTPDRRKAYTDHQNYQLAEKHFKDLLARLRDQHRINLHGIMCTTMEFCRYFSEAYALKYPA
ncbi:MAG: hypothetical protein PHC70_04345 [Patescibacteria group bacterium]|nr:hypothetical protein [Patescibacteria group bacterium]